MSNVTIHISANAVAWYGALVATVSAIIGSINFLRDKAKLKVTAYQAYIFNHMNTPQDCVFVDAVNVGRRPLTISSAGFDFNDKTQLAIIQPMITLPMELSEGKKFQTWGERDDMRKQITEEKKTLAYAWVKDASGKKYRVKVTNKGLGLD